MSRGTTPSAETVDPDLAQRRAADPAVSAWVGASAGAGKTKVLTDRVLGLLLRGTRPERILCVTFTTAAAAEMANRLRSRLMGWAVAGDAELIEALRALSGRDPDRAQMDAARRLFAEVLDAPGGIRIQTIHAFCQSVLRRFPLEAGVAPHFTVADERTQAELAAAARDDLILAAEREPDSEPARALAFMLGRLWEGGFADILQALLSERGRIERIVGASGGEAGLGARVAAFLGIPADATPESVMAEACAPGAADETALRRVVEAAARSSATTDGDFVAATSGWLASSAHHVEHFDAYAEGFIAKSTGRPKARIVTKAVTALLPEAVETVTAEAERLVAARERMAAAETLTATRAALAVGRAIEARYARRKAAESLLDYDDLILATRRLLDRSGPAWVLYKLDQGIDHVLVDEAQDTNPEQWELVDAITTEFFAGEGARPGPRTVFAVGDPKQSIFSFQRADPRRFGAMRELFRRRVEAGGERFVEVPFDFSFRSIQGVLDAVDETFADDEAGQGVVEPGRVLKHAAQRGELAGHIELWPPAPYVERKGVGEIWRAPTANDGAAPAQIRLARVIAAKIRDLIATREVLESLGRRVEAGDIMVLVRRRTAFGTELVRQLKRHGIGVAGVDRLSLGEQLAVKDVLALGELLVQPDDDLTLATVLKGPFVGLGEEELFDVARGRAGTLWRAVGEKAAAEPGSPYAAARDLLEGLLDQVDYVSPYELFAGLLGAGGGRRAIVERLGPEADDALDELLALALRHAQSDTPTMQDFLHWFGATETDVKRDLEHTGRDQVRLITVHGAKGLQAPIVFLPDTMQLPSEQRDPRLYWPEDEAGELMLWAPLRKDALDAVTRAVREEADGRRLEEYRRLLYVALTRAGDRLYIAGWETGSRPSRERSWYELVAAALERTGERHVFDFTALHPDGWAGDGIVRRFGSGGSAASPGRVEPVIRPELPEWAVAAPAEPRPWNPLAPSRPTTEPPVVSPLARTGTTRRFRRGLLIHRMLQTLPDRPPESRERAALVWLRAAAPELDEDARAAIVAEVLAVLGAPAFAPVFAPGSLAEVPIAGLVGETAVSGVVDRLAVTADRVLIADFKSNRPAPTTAEATPAQYLVQMARYRALARGVWPDRAIATALVWTELPLLVVLPDALLDAHESLAGK